MISVITTVYNGKEFFKDVFACLMGQTFSKFEWIIIDDGSTDGLNEFIESGYMNNDKFPYYYYSEGKLGRAKALNYAITKAKFEYIAILDCDDLWHPMKLEIQSKLLNNNFLIGTRSLLFRDPHECNIKQLTNDNINIEYISVFTSLVTTNTISHSSIVFKKNVIKYNEDLQSQVDMDLILKFLKLDKNKCIFISEVLTFHRIHENQYFESLFGMNYKLNSIKLQFKHVLFSKYFYLTPLILLRILYLLLPKKIRLLFRNIIKFDAFAK